MLAHTFRKCALRLSLGDAFDTGFIDLATVNYCELIQFYGWNHKRSALSSRNRCYIIGTGVKPMKMKARVSQPNR